MKYIIVLFCLYAFIHCRSAKNAKVEALQVDSVSDYFKLLEANMQHAVFGQNNGRSNLDYFIHLKVLTTKTIEFDSAWANGYGFETFVSRNSIHILSIPDPIVQGDTIIVRVSVIKETLGNNKTPPPFTFEGALLFRYYINKKTYYFNIPSLTTLPSPLLQ